MIKATSTNFRPPLLRLDNTGNRVGLDPLGFVINCIGNSNGQLMSITRKARVTLILYLLRLVATQIINLTTYQEFVNNRIRRGG